MREPDQIKFPDLRLHITYFTKYLIRSDLRRAYLDGWLAVTFLNMHRGTIANAAIIAFKLARLMRIVPVQRVSKQELIRD